MTPLRWIGCVALLLLVGTAPASAQSSADAYFHEAARQYVADNVPAARRAVEQGLAIAPSDPRLLALQKKLRQGNRPDGRQDSSSTGSQSGEQQNENQSSQSSTGGQKPSSEQSGAARTGKQESSSRQGGSRSAEPGPSEKRQNANAQSASGGQPGDRPAPVDTLRRGQGSQGGHAGTPLSRAQAERLLRALEGQERQLLRQLRMRSSSRQKVEKDW
ncbi:MAG TPA: hypothetical protein VJ884_01840 [Salinibacter sp.]|nr:hypothetical protein [Salinibacter sp.]